MNSADLASMKPGCRVMFGEGWEAHACELLDKDGPRGDGSYRARIQTPSGDKVWVVLRPNGREWIK